MGYVLGLRCGLFVWSLLWCGKGDALASGTSGVFVLLWASFVECFVGLVCSVVWCVFCVFGRLSAQICVYCVAVFWLFGGVPCSLVWCGVLVLLWGYFVVVCVFGGRCWGRFCR